MSHTLQNVPSADIRKMLEVFASVCFARADPKRWRRELLTGLCTLLNAHVGVALNTRNHTPSGKTRLDLLVDAGWKSTDQRHAYVAQLRKAPLGDPLLATAINGNGHAPGTSMTLLRDQVLTALQWQSASDFHDLYKSSDINHEVCWLHFGPEPGMHCCIRLFKPWNDRQPFSARDALLLDLLGDHAARLYLAELKNQSDTPGLSPRTQQTLSLLQAGKSEKHIAELLHLSTHTVHDYIKHIYKHFQVTSRSELLALFID